MNMEKTLLSLIIVTGVLCNSVINACMRSRCKLRSTFRYESGLNPFMKVKQVQSGIGISLDGRTTQRNQTDFYLENCARASGQGTVTTIHWKPNSSGPRYYLAVRAGKIKFEQVSSASVTDNHRFYIEESLKSPGHDTIRSKTADKYITTNDQGKALLGTVRDDRKAFFQDKFCRVLQ